MQSSIVRIAVFACLASVQLLPAFHGSAQQVADTDLRNLRMGVVRLEQLHGTGRVYLIQLGTHKGYGAIELAAWLRANYHVDTRLLDDAPLADSAYDASRKMYVAELLTAQIKREHPDLELDRKAFVIGFTDAPMYMATDGDDPNVNKRDGHRIAIISSGWSHADPDRADSLAEEMPAILRRVLLRDVAILFWNLPLNNNPDSLLYSSWNADVLTNDLQQDDLDPSQSKWGEALSDPCVVFTYSPVEGMRLTLDGAQQSPVQDCDIPDGPDQEPMLLATPDSPPNVTKERMELHLSSGLLSEKHTDFFLPGQVPIRLERTIENQYQQQAAFGISGSHNYDRFLSTEDEMHHIDIQNASGGDVVLKLEHEPTTFDMARWIDENASSKNLVLRWRGDSTVPHFDLIRYDGEVESYLPCLDGGMCYFNGYHDSDGNALIVKRDERRNLLSLTAPDGNWLHFSHPTEVRDAIRISKIDDNTGRKVLYGYNSRDQLETVTYPSDEVFAYQYDDQQDLLTVSVTQHGRGPTVLVTNYYEKGRLTSQTLADGRVYTYSYHGDEDSHKIDIAEMSDPDGTIFTVNFSGDFPVVRQRQLTSPPRHKQPVKLASNAVLTYINDIP